MGFRKGWNKMSHTKSELILEKTGAAGMLENVIYDMLWFLPRRIKAKLFWNIQPLLHKVIDAACQDDKFPSNVMRALSDVSDVVHSLENNLLPRMNPDNVFRIAVMPQIDPMDIEKAQQPLVAEYIIFPSKRIYNVFVENIRRELIVGDFQRRKIA